MTRRWRASQVIWLLVGLFQMCVLAMVVMLLRAMADDTDSTARRQIEGLARGAETALNRDILAVDLTLAGLEQMPGLFVDAQRTVNRTRAPDILRALRNQRLLTQDLVLFDARGQIVAAADEASARLGVALPAGFLAGVLAQPAPQLAISVPATSFSTGEKVLYFARAIGPPGRGRLVALATIPVSALNTTMAPALEVEGLTLSLENAQGELLASVPANDSMLGKRQGRLVQVGDQAGAAVLTGVRHGEGLAYTSVRPTLYGSVLVTAALSEAAALARTRDARFTTLAIGAVAMALAIVAGALVQTYLARLKAAVAETVGARLVLEEALASMDEGFLLWDAQDRVVSWNERYLQMFPHMRQLSAAGVSIDDMAQAAAQAMLPEADASQRRAWIAERLERHRADGQEFEQRLPGGQVISSVERHTATGGIVSIYRDVTRARAAAEELERARHKAEAANEAKTRFLATMSHEIRTPLNGVLGMNGLLLETALDAKQRTYVEAIGNSGETLLGIVNDVLDLSKLEAGRMEVELAPFDPGRAVDEVTALLDTRAAAKGISLTVDRDPDLPAVLVGDAGRIRQVLFNLIGNAIKFTEQGGVEVSSSYRARADGRTDWTVRVRDSGIGIGPESMPALFDRFTQADNSTSRRFGGSGLGLAISRELVQLMGGQIEVDSRIDEGSEFRFTLALALALAPATPEEAPADEEGGTPAGGAALHILVAEDNRVNQLLIETMLAQMGHSADLVDNGREALQQVQEAHYDLVLMDIQMPEMDGVSAARAIRQLPGPESRVPIISVSANVLADQRAAYLSAGMNDHVPKPIDRGRLAAAIAGAVATA